MRMNRENTVAVFVDIQERLYPVMSEKEQLLQNIVKIAKGLKVLNIPTVLTQQYTKGIGTTIAPIVEALGSDESIEKTTFSCCGEKAFLDKIKSINKKYVIVTGIETHVCVLQTVLDLIDAGFTPVLVEDCVTSRSLNDKKFAITRMQKAGAIITTYESVLFEITYDAKSPEFKEISKIVK